MKLNSKHTILGALIAASVVMLVTIGCKSSGPTNIPFSGPLELLYPKAGGLSFKVGDTVHVKWSIHDHDQITSVELMYSTDGGKTLNPNSIASKGSFIYPDTTYAWTPTAAQVSTQFILIARCYTDHSLKDQSAPFNVHN